MSTTAEDAVPLSRSSVARDALVLARGCTRKAEQALAAQPLDADAALAAKNWAGAALAATQMHMTLLRDPRR